MLGTISMEREKGKDASEGVLPTTAPRPHPSVKTAIALACPSWSQTSPIAAVKATEDPTKREGMNLPSHTDM